MTEKVYSMEVVGLVYGEPYRHTFWFRSAQLRKVAYEKVRWLAAKKRGIDLEVTLDSYTEVSPATVKRMIESRTHVPQHRGKEIPS